MNKNYFVNLYTSQRLQKIYLLNVTFIIGIDILGEESVVSSCTGNFSDILNQEIVSDCLRTNVHVI